MCCLCFGALGREARFIMMLHYTFACSRCIAIICEPFFFGVDWETRKRRRRECLSILFVGSDFLKSKITVTAYFFCYFIIAIELCDWKSV